ncbi:MAG: hypothetical protein AB8B69_17435 [Chitinophagales bacterium]
MITIKFTSKKIALLLFLTGFAVFFNACVKDEDFGKTEILLPDAKEMIVTNIFGLVVDENDLPVVNSEVSLKTDAGFEATTTDENGNFKYFNVRVVREGAFLKVHQSGKFEGFRKMNVTPESYNYTKIKLLDKTIVGSVSAASGGTVSHSSSASLKLAANSVRYESGGEYTGNVNVAMSWIDPTADDLPARMVGDLSGVDNEGKEVVLGTYGMLNVELLADNGDELQLKEGSPATLSFPVPTEIRSQAPSSIPLWAYNEDIGTWFEEGSAILQNGFYVGSVSHFSSWNCDYKGERISVTGKVMSRNLANEEVVMPFLQIYIEVENILNKGGFLDSSGEFEFFNFPANVEFTITIKDRCDEILYQEQFGPYADDTDLGTIIIQAANGDFVSVIGAATDCNDNSISDGHVDFELDDLHFIYPLQDNGVFDFAVNLCGDTSGKISVVDIGNLKASPVQTLDLTSNPTDAGVLVACDELPIFLNIEVDGAPYRLFLKANVNFYNQNGQVGDGEMHVTGDEFDEGVSDYYYADINGGLVTGVGTYNNVNGYFGSEMSGRFYSLVPASTTMEVTHFGENPGDLIRGTFTGQATAEDQGTTIQVEVSGSFKTIRQ